MRYLALGKVVELHRRLLEVTGGASGIRASTHLSSRSPNPGRRSGASICIRRWLRLHRDPRPVGDKERLILDLAAGRIGLSHLVDWLRQHVKPLA